MNSLYFRTLASASALAAFALTAVAQIQPSTPPASGPMAMSPAQMQKGSGSDEMKKSMMSGMEGMPKMQMSGDTDKDFAMLMKMHHQQALEMANDVPYALASSVWTTDHARAMRFSRDLDFGCVWINTHIPFVSDMPHGGFKHSGYGKDLSQYGFDDYTRIKHVMSALD